MDKIDEIIQTIKAQERGDTCPRGTTINEVKLRAILERYIQPSKPESECKCKGGRHCEVCRKADSGGAVIEKLNEVSPEVRDNINPDIVNLWDKLNEVIDRINKQ